MVAPQRRVSYIQNRYPQSRHDEATPQLGEAAREDYFRLRAMIAENEKQTEYLQKYIKTQCQ
ncbi:lysis system i-spanin subunit Rz [Candidatus Arsenophonus triatominarum]|uniref:lysis system i-spanin subunit Rz n=1 Tax=Candidatus Arsenophonus triatominarum TaxID=57911 RepID=UPI00316AD671